MGEMDEEYEFDEEVGDEPSERSIVSDHALEEIRHKVEELFKTFDESGEGLWIDVREVGNVLRCLGFCPTLEEIDYFVDHLMREDDRIHFDHFLPRIVAALEKNEWPAHSKEQIHYAFETIVDGTFINKEYLISMLTSLGEPLTPSEVEKMLNHLSINRNGEVDWAAYVNDVIEHINEK